MTEAIRLALFLQLTRDDAVSGGLLLAIAHEDGCAGVNHTLALQS
jgi:hypothetical protein